MEKAILPLLAAIIIGTAKPAEAAGSIEFVQGDKASVVDIKAAAEPFPETTVFARTIAQYDGERADIILAGYLWYNLFGEHLLDIDNQELQATLELQYLPNGETVPRAGLVYTVSRGNFKSLALATHSLDGSRNFFTGANLSYKDQIWRNLDCMASFEIRAYIGYGDENSGLNLAVERLRLGACLDTICSGAAIDLKQTGPEIENHSPNYGGFLSVGF